MRILIDECLNWRLGRALTGHYAASVQKMGWSGVKNYGVACTETRNRRDGDPMNAATSRVFQSQLAGHDWCIQRQVSLSLLCFVTLFMHATTSTPSADRVLLMAHPSVIRAFTVPITVRLFRDTRLTGFRAGSIFGAAVFSSCCGLHVC